MARRRNNRVAVPPVNHNVPADIAADAREAKLPTLPPVPRDKYLKHYEAYKAWCRERGTPHISEDSLLIYVRKLSVEATIKANLSMVKACIKAFDGVDIGAYVNVNSHVRTASKKHKPKKARILTAQQLHQFCNVAPDAEFFLIKVILIVGVIGCCRKSELVKLLMAYVTVTDTSILIDIPPEVTKTNTANTFSIVGPSYVIVKRYLEARKNIDNEKFFLLYRDGTFIDSACGDRTIGAIPKTVAEFLGLPEPERYTSHSIRRSSATVYAESGCTDTERHKVSAQITNAILPEEALQDQKISVFSNHWNIFPETAKKPWFPKTAKKPLSHLARNKSSNSSATVTSGMSSDITAPSGQRNSPILSNSITSARQQLSKFVRKPFTGTNKTVSSGMANIFSAPRGQHHSTSLPSVANRAAVVMQVPTASTHVTVAGPMLAQHPVVYRSEYEPISTKSAPSNKPMDNPVMDAVQEDLTDFFEDDFADDEPWTMVLKNHHYLILCDPCMSPDPPAPIFLELFEPTPSHVCMRLIKAPPQLSSEKPSPAVQPEVRERSDICGHVPANSSEIVRSPGRRSSSLSHPINHMDFEEHSHSNVDGEFGYIEGRIPASAGGAADSSVLAPGFHLPPSNQEPSHIHSPHLSPEKPPPAISAGGAADSSVLASGVHQLLSNQEPPHIHSQPQQSDNVEQIIVPRVQSIQSPKVVVITTDKVNSSSTEFPQQSGCSGFTSPSANPGHLGAIKSDCVDGLDSHEEKPNVSDINHPNMDPNQCNSSVNDIHYYPSVARLVRQHGRKSRNHSQRSASLRSPYGRPTSVQSEHSFSSVSESDAEEIR
ncbi:hypothetical protein QAD02_014412 [Eretmocerus hayati]|uniref:Uncharacterized protein n=1 Tax=Eretmocerus hayati TaxID=131215 RepID=A0ACC2P4Z0_9HYME|nr:hypothetical protein QAD02_014412 [Eretmocerus hayati]